MRKLQLINTELEKPWYLIAVYDSLFETQCSLYNKLAYVETGAMSGSREMRDRTIARIAMLKDAIKETSKALVEADQKIHDYIVKNNKLYQLPKAS